MARGVDQQLQESISAFVRAERGVPVPRSSDPIWRISICPLGTSANGPVEARGHAENRSGGIVAQRVKIWSSTRDRSPAARPDAHSILTSDPNRNRPGPVNRKGPHADAVAPDMNSFRRIPDREGPLAVEILDASFALFVVGTQDDFRIALRSKPATAESPFLVSSRWLKISPLKVIHKDRPHCASAAGRRRCQ